MPRKRNRGRGTVPPETMARIAEEFRTKRAMLHLAKSLDLSGSDPGRSSALFLFGDDFELDLGACELRRFGQPRKLSRTPMEILHLLVERQGCVVERQEISQKIWGEEVSIDADRNINESVRRIRRALNERPDQFRFLQTVHGKGYRFVAPVTRVPQVVVG